MLRESGDLYARACGLRSGAMNEYACRNCGLHGNRVVMSIHVNLWQCTNRDTAWTWRVYDGEKRPTGRPSPASGLRGDWPRYHPATP